MLGSIILVSVGLFVYTTVLDCIYGTDMGMYDDVWGGDGSHQRSGWEHLTHTNTGDNSTYQELEIVDCSDCWSKLEDLDRSGDGTGRLTSYQNSHGSFDHSCDLFPTNSVHAQTYT